MKRAIEIIKNENGYSILISVIVLAGICTSLAVSLLLSSTSQAGAAIAFRKSTLARGYANSCMESALEQIRQNSSYTGTINLSFTSGSCSAMVSGTAPTKSITSTGISDTVTRRVQGSTTQVSPSITLNNWQEF